MGQVCTMKLTESANICYTNDVVACTIKVNIKESFIRTDGFLQMFMWWMDYSQRMKDLLLEKFSIQWEKDFWLLITLCSMPSCL